MIEHNKRGPTPDFICFCARRILVFRCCGWENIVILQILRCSNWSLWAPKLGFFCVQSSNKSDLRLGVN